MMNAVGAFGDGGDAVDIDSIDDAAWLDCSFCRCEPDSTRFAASDSSWASEDTRLAESPTWRTSRQKFSIISLKMTEA